jgi:hypothetical protein
MAPAVAGSLFQILYPRIDAALPLRFIVLANGRAAFRLTL